MIASLNTNNRPDVTLNSLLAPESRSSGPGINQKEISPRDKGLIASITQFDGTPIEVLRSIALLEINSSNDSSVHKAVGGKLEELINKHPAYTSIIKAFRSCFIKVMQAPPKQAQKQQLVSQAVDETTELDVPQSFGLYVKAPDLAVLQKFSEAQLLLEKWLQDTIAGNNDYAARGAAVIKKFKETAASNVKDLTIAQLCFSALYDTIGSLDGVDGRSRYHAPTFQAEILDLAQELCAQTLKEHSLSANGLLKNSPISERTVAAALLVFEFSTTLMNDIPEGIGPIGYQPLINLLGDRRIAPDTREAVIARLKIVAGQYSCIPDGINNVLQALRKDGEEPPEWLVELSCHDAEKYVNKAHNTRDIFEKREIRQASYKGYFLRLTQQLLNEAELLKYDDLSGAADNDVIAEARNFKPEVKRTSWMRQEAPHIFVECIKRGFLGYAKPVLSVWSKLPGLSTAAEEDVSKIRANFCLLNDFDPKVPAWRTLSSGFPFIIPSEEPDKPIHVSDTVRTSPLSDTPNQTPSRPISLEKLREVLQKVPFIVLDTTFCATEFARIQSASHKNPFDVNYRMQSLIKDFNDAITETKRCLSTDTTLADSSLLDFSALTALISPSDTQPATPK